MPDPRSDYRFLLDRILRAVDQEAYLAPISRLRPEEREALRPFQDALASGTFDVEVLRAQVRALGDQGRIDRVKMFSALQMIACHPRVADWAEAARLTGEQELAALELGGPELDANLASVDRHRGVLAFLRGHYAVALDYFARTIERERTAENLGNVLCAMVRLGETQDAVLLFHQISASYPDLVVRGLVERIRQDPDLVVLRTEVPV